VSDGLIIAMHGIPGQGTHAKKHRSRPHQNGAALRGKGSMNAKRALVAILAAAPAVLVFVIPLYNTMESERAALTITKIGFEPFPLVANQREFLVISFKNTGHNYATIDAVSTDRVKSKLPDNPIYDPANFTPTRVPGGEEQQIVSDVGDRPLIFTQSEIDSLNASRTQFKVIGFMRYTDQRHSWILGGGVLQFCYVWDFKVPDGFSVCSERRYTRQYDFRFRDGLRIREVPLITIGTQTTTPITLSPKIQDPNYPIQKIEIRPKK
jgi:hypothetical protein